MSILRQIYSHDEARPQAQKAYPSQRILSRYIHVQCPKVYYGQCLEKSPHHEKDERQDHLILSAREDQVVDVFSVEMLVREDYL